MGGIGSSLCPAKLETDGSLITKKCHSWLIESVRRSLACMVPGWRPKARHSLEIEDAKEKNYIDVTTKVLIKEYLIHKIVHG